MPGHTLTAKLRIETGQTRQTRTMPRLVPKAWEAQVDKIIQAMLDSEGIKKCYSPRMSSIVPVAKKDGAVRVCINFREVNKVTQSDPYPIPKIENLFEIQASVN